MRRALTWLVLAALLPLTACGGDSERLPPCPKVKPSGVQVPRLTGRIAYTSLAGGGGHCHAIIVMNADGSGRHRITGPELYPFSAEWSPDGTQLVFAGACQGADRTGQICIVSADGSGLHALTDTSTSNDSPAWSPDGRRIAFVRNDERLGPFDLYIMNADGTGEVRLTSDAADQRGPSWTPDGQSLVYTLRTGTEQLQVIKATGGPSTPLSPGGTVNQTPAVSHDGKRVAFSSNRSMKGESAYGQSVRQTPGGDLLPPPTGAHDIYVVGIDGRSITRLTNDDSGNYHPVWSPDDRHIAFTSDRDGRQEVYVMGADGGSQTRLTNHPDDGAGVKSWTR